MTVVCTENTLTVGSWTACAAARDVKARENQSVHTESVTRQIEERRLMRIALICFGLGSCARPIPAYIRCNRIRRTRAVDPRGSDVFLKI